MANFIRFIVLFFFFPFTVVADAPYVLVLWHTDNTARTNFTCNPVIGDDGKPSKTEIDCESVTTFFSKEEKPGEFDDKWSNLDSEITQMFDSAGRMLPTQDNMLNEICSDEPLDYIRLILDMPLKTLNISDEQKEEALAKMVAMKPIQLDDIKTTGRNYLVFCKNPTLNNYKEMALFEFNKGTRTCSIFNDTNNERYTKVNDNLWVHQTEAGILDPCKRIAINSLRRPEGGASYDWEYELRTIAIDKSAEYLGKSCAEFEEKGTDLYTNRSEPVFLGCDYFSY